MKKEDITKIIIKELSEFECSQPEHGSTLGTPWSNEKVMSYIPKLQAALVEPYLQSFLLKDTYEQMNNTTDQYAEYWVIAKDNGYYQWYDPKTNEFGLAHKNNSKDQLITIGVTGDLVGVYCAM